MPNTTENDRLLTVDDLAEMLQTHRVTVLRWASIGWLPPPLRLGPARRWLRWRREAIEQFLREKEGVPDAAHAS